MADLNTQETAGQYAEVNPDASKGRQGTRSRTQVKTSYLRPNRDYSNQINWSYELNKHTYEVYKVAEPSKRGYMQRMKEEWDKIHPKYDYLTSKHLREQAMGVIKKKLIREIQTEPEQVTETNEQRANTSEDNQVREVREDNVCTDSNCRRI